MTNPIQLSLAALVLACATSCTTLPTLESIQHGYSNTRIEGASEPPSVSDYNDVASGWAPEPVGEAAPSRPLLGFDGSPVGASSPGTVTTTTRPMNDGVATQPGPGGSREHVLDRFVRTSQERDDLLRANEDLNLALDMSATRANDFAEQLKSLQAEYEALATSKQAGDAQSFELAARLATAQIERLRAERALLEATIEWRRMSANNNRPLSTTGAERP